MNKKFRFAVRQLLAVTAFILLYHTPVMAQTQSLYPGILDRSRAIKSAAQVTRIKYPNADTVDIDIHKWVKYHQDGTYIEWFECYTKILTEKGRNSFKTLSSSFTIPYNDTAFKVAEIITDDGTVKTVDTIGNSRVMIEPSQMDANIYNPNSKILRLNIPELNIGDTLHYIIRDNFAKVQTPGTWSDYVTLEGTSPIKRSAFTVIAPKTNPLQKIALKSEIPGTVTFKKHDRGDRIVYKWIAKNVPMAIPEPNMPPFYTQVQRLLVSTIRDWESISRWYWDLCEPNLEKTTPAMAAMVAELIRDKKDPDQQMQAIFKWVSQKIRYLGLTVEKDAPGYEPHPVSMTFDQRAGVCRDKAALLTAMLRMAGLEAYPVLIMNGPKKDPEVPQPFFNHAVTAVREPDGSYRLMDSTDENTSRMFPSYLDNQSYLVATPAGETLLTSPVTPAEQNMMAITTKGSLDAGGHLTAESELHFNGINDNAYRGFFARISPDEQRGFFEKIIKHVAPGARLTHYTLLPENMQDTTQPLTVVLAFESGDIRVAGGDTVMLPVPKMGENLGMIHYLLGRTGLEKRHYPIFTEYACGVTETMNLKLNRAVGKLKNLPQFQRIEDQGVSWSCDLSLEGDALHCETAFKLNLPQYSPDQYLALRETLKKIESANRKMVLFQKPSVSPDPAAEKWYSAFQADAVVLNEDIEYRVEDARHWTQTRNVTIKVLTYAGKKKYSDIRLDYNPIWEEVVLEKAQVTAPSGKTGTVTKQQINIMDAPWVGDAPRYPAAKTMVVSLPGVEQGSVIEITVVSRKKNQSFFSIGGNFFRQEMKASESDQEMGNRFFSANPVFRYTDPILKKTIRLQIPSNLPIKIFSADQGLGLDTLWKRPPARIITKKARTEGGWTRYEFTAEQVAPVKPEKDLPPWYSFNPVLLVSAGSWETYCETVYRALRQAALFQPEITTKARQLIEDSTGDDNRIQAIRDFVARHVKPVDIGLSELPVNQITPAARTLADGYGNAADRAVLLYALLNAAGYNPEFILVSQSSRVTDLQQAMREYPAPQWFDTVLVRVKGSRGPVYLNDTDQYSKLGAPSLSGFPGMEASSGRFETIQAQTTDLSDGRDSTYAIELFKNGDAVITRKTLYYGNEFAAFHKQFSEMPPEKRRRHLQEEVNRLSKSATVLGKYTVDYKTYPGIETFSARVPGYATLQDNYLYLTLPGLIRDIKGIGRDQRTNPIYRDDANHQSVEIELLLPDEMDSIEIMPPEDFVFHLPRSGAITIRTRPGQNIQGQARSLRIRQEINLDPVVMLPDTYLQLLEVDRILNHPKTGMVLMKMKRRE